MTATQATGATFPWPRLYPGNGGAGKLAALPSFLRVLLITDGTVTKSLEAYFWEPVTVHNLGQGMETLSRDERLMGKRAGDTLLQRRVKLLGSDTGRVFAWADSWIDPDLLTAEVKVSLEAGLVGIGELLRQRNVETYREIVEIGFADPQFLAALPDPLNALGECVWRRYLIISGGKPFMQITEYFPLERYLLTPGGAKS